MPNPSYRRGRAAEYELKKKLELAGYKVLRTAGSHGDFDLVAYRTNSVPVRLIQVKTTGKEDTLRYLLQNTIPEDEYTHRSYQQEFWIKYGGVWHSNHKIDGTLDKDLVPVV